MKDRENINILGAGLCGSLLAVMMARRGFPVRVRELRPDPRSNRTAAGRSINLALSARGMRGLCQAGIFDRVRHLLLPMRGRMIHELDGRTSLLPYGQREHERIHSVSRAELNRILIDVAERELDVEFLFGHGVTGYDTERHVVALEHDGQGYELPAEALFVADGAGSRIRRAYDGRDPIDPRESLLAHSYKELTIPSADDGGFRIDAEALHIWPRSDFMLIALPNPGGDFTLTLFMPDEGDNSFASVTSGGDAERFFARHFADALPLIDDLAGSWERNPAGILGTVRCRHWHVDDRFLLVGDAAHAIVPFHGQGMNLAFEDCVLLDELIGDSAPADWAALFAEFESRQLANANAIADMALENYVEMRDTVRDPSFALQKELAFELERRLPDRFIPRYSMVMFHDEIPYAQAQQRGEIQSQLLRRLTEGAAGIGEIDLDDAERQVIDMLEPVGASVSLR